jgi:hypothetical protein
MQGITIFRYLTGCFTPGLVIRASSRPGEASQGCRASPGSSPGCLTSGETSPGARRPGGWRRLVRHFGPKNRASSGSGLGESSLGLPIRRWSGVPDLSARADEQDLEDSPKPLSGRKRLMASFRRFLNRFLFKIRQVPITHFLVFGVIFVGILIRLILGV